MRIAVIDNYDSFTYNLVQILAENGQEHVVMRNDEFELDQLDSYDKILISPGPGVPNEAGLTKPLIEQYYKNKSILGICLGHQAIGEVFGAKLINMEKVYHGVATEIRLNIEEPLFQGVPEKAKVGRYHSWCVSADLPKELIVTAIDDQGQPMAIRHKEYDVQGIQFHPESILTPNGKQIIENWINNQK